MYLTITLRLRGREYDIQADSNLPVERAIRTVSESMRIYEGAAPPAFYKSAQQSRVISGAFTFEQARIQNGDILAAIEG